ncbi:hypothetical protein AcW1_007142 [Taiwanofungus camphoratus]|nr:hypothetical protein AcW1_007142 [Antrodia cinnamomea]
MMVYGTGFCVAMSDRRGVALSPHGDVIEKPEPVHAHPAVTRCADRALSSLEMAGLSRCAPPTSYYQPGYPSFCVTVGGNDAREWRTVGPPLFSALSLFGRGTSIWAARSS